MKNFGVSRTARVAFYDYDELCLVIDYNFRDLPNAEYPEDEMRADSWFYVAKNDVFRKNSCTFPPSSHVCGKLFSTLTTIC